MNKNFLVETIVKKIKHQLLNEGVIDQHVLALSRFIIHQFKNKQDFEMTYYFERGDDYADFDFIGNFIEDEEMEDPFSIHAESDMQTFEIEITYNPKEFPKSMSDLVAEVKETVVHELEHIMQQNFQDMEIEDEDDYTNNFEYLTSKVEVPAYVKGLIKRANTKRITLDDVMEEWFKENRRKFDDPENEWKQVKKIWKDYAFDMLKKQKIKKFK
jgi:hypothetical protein